MPVYLKTNPYKGINAHFNSYLLAERGGWLTYHNRQIVYLENALNRALPNGYYAVSEPSLQIQRPDQSVTPNYPDVAILKMEGHTPPSPALQTASPTLALPTLEVDTLDPNQLTAVLIYRQGSRGYREMITRLELLSPSNKRPIKPYLDMRSTMLRLGIHMVDLDFLHEFPPLFKGLQADYTQQEPHASPYTIIISEAPPEEGQTQFYQWHVDEPIPPISVPLAGHNQILLDVEAAYQACFGDDRRAHTELDYSQLPAHFGSYQPADQERIRAVMERVQQEVSP